VCDYTPESPSSGVPGCRSLVEPGNRQVKHYFTSVDVVEIEADLGGTNQPRATLDDHSFLNHDEAQSTGASAISIGSFKIDGRPVHILPQCLRCWSSRCLQPVRRTSQWCVTHLR